MQHSGSGGLGVGLTGPSVCVGHLRRDAGELAERGSDRRLRSRSSSSSSSHSPGSSYF